jgi:hypothetical protein
MAMVVVSRHKTVVRTLQLLLDRRHQGHDNIAILHK